MLKKGGILLSMFFFVFAAFSQDKAILSGSLQSNGNFFIRDESIGAANTPQYDKELFGAESWLTLNTAYKGFNVGIRFDMFNNSNLPDPQKSYTEQGLGMWYIKKKINNLDIGVGYLYDQIGSGILFRAYEERSLAIDNALMGVSLGYEINENVRLKAFTGRQKNKFSLYESIIKGGTIEGFYSHKDGKWSISPGIGVVNRTFDKEMVDNIVSKIETYTPQDSIGAQYNTYGVSLFNTVSAGSFSWYFEGALKSNDVMYNSLTANHGWSGTTSLGKLINEKGSVFYSTISYAAHGLGVTIEGKRTENFNFRTTPFEQFADGAINFLPPMVRNNTYRLTARYAAPTQEFGEMGLQLDVKYRFNKKFNMELNTSFVNDLENVALYRELYTEFSYKQKREWLLIGGVQYQEYNQDRYENKPGVDNIQTITPYVDFLYRFTRKKSLRTELSYMNTEQDYGSWAYGLMELSLAPHWVFIASDMYNVKPKKSDKKKHYYSVGVVYRHKANRFSLDYVKQVKGIVCTGGICRLEPAFSGVKFTVNSSF